MTTKGAVLITGTSSGIGEACALLLSSENYRVFAGVRKEKDADKLSRLSNGNIIPVFLDITDENSIENSKNELIKSLKGDQLIALVNNAGIAIAGSIESLPLDKLRLQFEVNVIGHVAVIQAFLPLLRESKGRIINMSSIFGRMSSPYMGAYCASKFALEGLSDSLRMELAEWGIYVSLIEPSIVTTPIWEKSINNATEMISESPDTLQDLYGKNCSIAFDSANRTCKTGITPGKVAEKVLEALTADKPKPRYLVGLRTKLISVLTNFPEPIKDKIVLREVGL